MTSRSTSDQTVLMKARKDPTTFSSSYQRRDGRFRRTGEVYNSSVGEKTVLILGEGDLPTHIHSELAFKYDCFKAPADH
jgi:hypothetical protein